MRISLSNVLLSLMLLAGCFLLSAQSPQECPVEDLPLNRVRSASLAQGDCVSRGRFADVYRIRLRKRGTLQIRVASNSFKPELVLAAEAGRRITSSESLELRWDLTPGAYIVYVTTATAGASGGYTIRASLLEACPVISLELNSHRSSALTPDCRNSNSQPEHRYTFRLDQPGRVVAELETQLARTYITLWGPDDEPIAGGAKSVLSAPLVPGAYRLYVKTKDNSTGPYSLRIHGPCPVGEFKISGELAGALGPDDCRASEVLLDSTDSSYCRHFQFWIASRGLLSLSLSSLQDTMSLLVLNDAGAKVGDTSASPSGTPSSLNIRLVPGSYTMRLSSNITTLSIDIRF